MTYLSYTTVGVMINLNIMAKTVCAYPLKPQIEGKYFSPTTGTFLIRNFLKFPSLQNNMED